MWFSVFLLRKKRFKKKKKHVLENWILDFFFETSGWVTCELGIKEHEGEE